MTTGLARVPLPAKVFAAIGWLVVTADATVQPRGLAVWLRAAGGAR